MNDNRSPSSTITCENVHEHLIELLDTAREPSPEIAEHLVECDACRDLRFELAAELEAAIETAKATGADYAHPEDFVRRLAAKLDATELRETATKVPSLAPLAPPRAGFFAGIRSIPPAWGLAAVAAAALGLLWVLPKGSQREASHAPPDTVGLGASALVAGSGWSGEVLAIWPSTESAGLTACNSAGTDCAPLRAKSRFPTGRVLVTDGKTRAALSLDDGSELTLDRGTRVELSSPEARHARLLQGSVVLDVRPSAAHEARLELPQGRVEVLGTKFSAHTANEMSWVNVSRGRVRLVDQRGRSVSLASGEGGRLHEDRAPVAQRLSRLSDAFAWSERIEERAPLEEERIPRGLGELRAKKPGEDHERTGAVRLTRQDVEVRISGSMARTEVHQEYSNQTDEVLEGIYRFALPPNAKIERLALEVDGRWEEGAFLDRERAGAIWRGAIVNSAKKKPPVVQDIVWVPGPWKDPALLEWQRGGSFELRVFPIPKRGARRIVLAYTEWLEPAGDLRRYTYPLPHDPSGSVDVGDFGIDVQVRGHTGKLSTSGVPLVSTEFGALGDGFDDRAANRERLSFRARDFTPTGDVVIEFQQPPTELRAIGYGPRHETGYVALALRPELPLRSEARERSVVLVVDRSRSLYGEHFERARRLAARIARELDPDTHIGVLACDATCDAASPELLPASPSTLDTIEAFLSRQEAEGASDLVAALSRAGRWLEREPTGNSHILYIGDGSATVGPIQPGLIRTALSGELGRTSVSAVTVGSAPDEAALRAITDLSGGVLLRYAPGSSAAEAAYDVLAATAGQTLRQVSVELPPELTQISPSQIGTIAPGGEALVVARMNGTRVSGPVVLRGRIGDEAFERRYTLELETTNHAGNAFVPRLYAAARIAELERDGSDAAKRQAIALSERFNVASRYTSLLVLESPAMFQAFGLRNERHAPLWTGEENSREELAEGSHRGGAAPPADTGWDLVDDEAPTSIGRGRSAPSRPEPELRAAAPRPKSSSGPGEPSKKAESKEDSRDSRFAPPPPVITPRPLPPFEPEPRQMIPMRRIWESSGKITPWEALVSRLPSDLSRKESAVRENPQSRQALKELYAAYVIAGDFERAGELAERWSAKDPLDPDALTARADLAAQRGDRELAIRILGSVIDVRPSEHAAQWRLARLFRWAGDLERSCAHHIALAQLQSTRSDALTDALRCTRALGRVALERDLQAAASPQLQAAAEAKLRETPPSGLSGEFQIEARWDGGGHDLDLVLLHPEGYRVSWLGAPTRAVISSEDALSTHREGLALRGVSPGRYVVEIVRGQFAGDAGFAASRRADGVIQGTIEIRFRGERRSLPFVLAAERARVAVVDVTTRQRLVPL